MCGSRIVCRDWKEEFCGGTYLLTDDDEDEHGGGSSMDFTQTSLLDIGERAEVGDWVLKSLGLNRSFGSVLQGTIEALSKRAKAVEEVHIYQMNGEVKADASTLSELDSSVQGKCTR
jgi:hypothetical protein